MLIIKYFASVSAEVLITSTMKIALCCQNDKTIVKEKLCEKFVNCELRLIESSKLPVKCWNDGEQGLVRLTQHDGQHVHVSLSFLMGKSS